MRRRWREWEVSETTALAVAAWGSAETLVGSGRELSNADRRDGMNNLTTPRSERVSGKGLKDVDGRRAATSSSIIATRLLMT
jgi:hypothetical protein